MKSLQSVFAGHLSAYIQLRRTLGFRSGEPAYFLEAFDGFVLEKEHTGPLTQELALEFACSNPKTSTNYCAKRYQVVRHFSEYLATFDPQTPFLDPKALERSKARTPRHIYTDQELQKTGNVVLYITGSTACWPRPLNGGHGLSRPRRLPIRPASVLNCRPRQNPRPMRRGARQ